MSTDTQEPMEMGTKPVAEHQWLQKLVGRWQVESEMMMGPDAPPMTSTGEETVTSLGGLWAVGDGYAELPNGERMEYRTALGYDVSFKEYRGCQFMSLSSHLWKYTGTLSADGRTMTLDCVGPDMERDGETANYRDVVVIVDDNHRTRTSSGQDASGAWFEFAISRYTRI